MQKANVTKKVFSKYSEFAFDYEKTVGKHHQVKGKFGSTEPQEIPVEWSVILEVSRLLIPLVQSFISLFSVSVPAFIQMDSVPYFLTIRWTDTGQKIGVAVGYFDDNGNSLRIKNNFEFVVYGSEERPTKKALKSLLEYHNVI